MCRSMTGGGLVAQSGPTLATLWPAAHQAPLSMGFSRQEYCSGLPFPSLGIFWTKGSNPGLPHCRQMLLLSEPPGKPRLVSVQYATGEEWRNNSRKNEETEAKQKQHPVVEVTGNGSKIQCCKEQYCIGTWNFRSMNQGKLEVVKQVWQE